MKIGYIGVGKWATQLKQAFEARGHETVWHMRSDSRERLSAREYEKPDFSDKNGWGYETYFDYGMICHGGSVDLTVWSCPPDPLHHFLSVMPDTPALCTKPFDESRLSTPRRAPTYVDLWRVLTPEWEEFKGRSRSNVLHVKLGGAGPRRDYLSGAMDYGPHAIAYCVDFGVENISRSTSWDVNYEGFDNAMLSNGSCAVFGNRMPPGTHSVCERSPNEPMAQPSKPAGLAKLVEHCETGNTYTYELNKRVMHELRNVPWVVK